MSDKRWEAWKKSAETAPDGKRRVFRPRQTRASGIGHLLFAVTHIWLDIHCQNKFCPHSQFHVQNCIFFIMGRLEEYGWKGSCLWWPVLPCSSLCLPCWKQQIWGLKKYSTFLPSMITNTPYLCGHYSIDTQDRFSYTSSMKRVSVMKEKFFNEGNRSSSSKKGTIKIAPSFFEFLSFTFRAYP